MRLIKSKILGLVLLFCLIITLISTVSAATPVWSGGPYTFTGSNPVTTSGNIGISGNSPWSIAAWVYSYTGGPNNGYGWGIAGWGNAASNQGNFLYYNDGERTFEYGFYGNDAQTAANYNPNTWYHIADTWDGTTQRIYVNGTLVTSRTPGSRSLANTTAKIGTDPFGQGRNFQGGMERVQIYNVALSASEVSALAASAPTWTPGGSSTPTPTPTPSGGTQPVWSGGPYTFNGSNPVTTSSNIGISGNSPWTMAGWIYSFTGGPNNGYGWGIVGWGTGASNQGNFLYYNDAERTFEYGFYGNDAQTAANYNPNTWYHIANSWDGTTQRIYVNGAQVASRTPGARSLTNTTAKIGTDPFGQGRNFQGGMERVQIYNVALSASQISSLAASPPTWTPSGPTPTPTSRPGTPTPTSPPMTGSLIRMEPLPGTKINSTFWNARVKNVITTWIPYCYNQLSNTSLAEGGINNFIQAGRKLSGQSYSAHVGYWFSNAYVHNTVEAMCYALMIDPQGDSAIISAQNAMRAKLDDWIPKILSAQESDGYLHTWTTLGNKTRWSDRAAHEGYTAGYFLEAAIAHYLMTNRTDARLYNAAKKLATCWVNNKPGQGQWWDGHQEMEMALTRFGTFVKGVEGGTLGDTYINCAKRLLDVRYSSSSGQYDQSHAYPINQTKAVGHAVRAVYMYSGMIDVGALLNNSSYISASTTLWDNLINRQMYITGGLGSGESSEGFGPEYSLPNANAYCESCAGCGNVFFNSNFNMYSRDGKYVDIMQQSLYNNVLGSLTLNANLYTYTNSLDTTNARYSWHVCPCCVGNIPRTILALPKWIYAKSSNGIYVNMYAGSTVTVPGVSGTNVQMVQTTNYPWETNVTITVNPSAPANFTVYLHSPDRSVSTCYSSTPTVNGLSSITVNGSSVSATPSNGYVAINRTWNAGDRIELTVPMSPQRVKAVSNVAACSGRVAIQYGPLVYNAEAVDHNNADVRNLILSPSSALTAQWNASLLGGVMTIKGTFTNGQAMTLIPNYARLNRGGRSTVWLRDQ